MNMMSGSNVLAMLTSRAQEILTALAEITTVTPSNCGDVKDLADDGLKLSKEIDESRALAKKPHLDAASGVDDAFVPLRDSVAASARAVKKLVEAFVIAEKKRAEAEAAEARRKAEELLAAKAEEDPFLADTTAVVEAQTAVAIADTRALASRQVMSATGLSKASSLRVVRSAVVTDPKALVLFYAEHPDVLGAATKCANAAIRAAKGGPCVIPGIEIKEEEKLV